MFSKVGLRASNKYGIASYFTLKMVHYMIATAVHPGGIFVLSCMVKVNKNMPLGIKQLL